MGVPLTYLNVHNPEQFEIVDMNPHFFTVADRGLPKQEQFIIKGRKKNGKLKEALPIRVLIKRKGK